MLELVVPVLLFFITIFLMVILAKKWIPFSNFFHSHYTYFSIVFVIFYALEQALFLILSRVSGVDSFTLIGLFALIVLTTATLQGIMMESRNKNLSASLEKSHKEYVEKTSEMKRKYEFSLNKLRSYIDFLQNELYFMEKNKLKK
jgi:hypothetical protein